MAVEGFRLGVTCGGLDASVLHTAECATDVLAPSCGWVGLTVSPQETKAAWGQALVR